MNLQIKLAYAAGIMDGDGCFCLAKTTKYNNHLASITVKMTDRVVPTWLKAELGGNIHFQASSDPKGENTYQWSISNRQHISRLIPDLLPYLKTKRLSAIVILEFCQRFPGAGKRYTEEEKTIMSKYCDFMTVVNGRGPGSTMRKERLLRLVES